MGQSPLKGIALNWPFRKEAYEAFCAEVWPVIDAIPGYLHRLEAFFLYHTARTLQPARSVDQPPANSVVEIGSYKGRSTAAIGLGLRRNASGPWRLYCVDHFFQNQGEPGLKEAFLANVQRAGLEGVVTCLPEASSEAVKRWPVERGIAMLWIDGNHDEAFVRDDFQLWKRFVVPGGVVAFDDWYLLGVRRVILDDLFPDPTFQDLAVIDHNLIAATKVDTLPTREQNARKRRIYWTLRTGSLSPWRAGVVMAGEWVNRPFGHVGRFFTDRLPLQRITNDRR